MNLQELSERAWSHMESNQLTDAKALFAQIVELDAGDAEGWMMLGTLHGVFGEMEQAVACLERALALDTHYAEAHLNLGKMRLVAGQLEAALASLGQALASDPQQTEAWLLLGGLYGRLGRFEEAEASSRQALALLPGSVEARLHLANALCWQGKLSASDADTWLARPILVTGIPRSGTSLVAGCLAACGAWVGETMPGNASNPEGYFENQALREGVVKAQLRQLGADPLGVKLLPRLSGQPPQPKLGAHVLTHLLQQGYKRDQPWLYKGAKLTLVWPPWRLAFPHARWLVVRRPAEEIVESCLRTDFMRQHSGNRAFWYRWVQAYVERLEILKASGIWWREIESGRLIREGPQALHGLVKELELEWNAEAVGALIKPQHWHARRVAQPEAPEPPGVTWPCRVMANSVPKSGTHLLGKTLSLLSVHETDTRLYGNFGTRSLRLEETAEQVTVGGVWPSLVPVERLGEVLAEVKAGQFIQGHLPYAERVARLMEAFAYRMVLIIRDPRAVAVSQVQWALARDYLPAHAVYRRCSEPERLRLAIKGYCFDPEGPVAVSLRRRYEQMLPWMDHPAVYTTRFEWLAGPQGGGDREVQLRELRNIAAHIGIEAPEARLAQVAEELFGGTMTFKGGQIERWKEQFTEEHKTLIKDEMGDLIVRLGYERDTSW